MHGTKIKSAQETKYVRNSTDHRPSWGANRAYAIPDLHHRNHNNPQPVPILSQINSLSAHTFYFFKIHFNIIFPSTPRSSKWSYPLRYPHQNPACTSPVPHTCNIPHPSRSSWFDRPKNSQATITKLLVTPSSPILCYLIHLPLGPYRILKFTNITNILHIKFSSIRSGFSHRYGCLSSCL